MIEIIRVAKKQFRNHKTKDSRYIKKLKKYKRHTLALKLFKYLKDYLLKNNKLPSK